MPFALPTIAIVHRYRLIRRDWAGAAAVGGGIAVIPHPLTTQERDITQLRPRWLGSA